MKRKIDISQAKIVDGTLYLYASDSLSHLKPAGQILVDSEQTSFIYLMETPEDYTYVVLPESLWPILKEGLEGQSSVWIKNDTEQIELTDFYEELAYVIQNIQGNSNYGENMVQKTEEYFGQ